MNVGLVSPLKSAAEVVEALVGEKGAFVVVAAAVVVVDLNLLMNDAGEVVNGDGVVRESRKFLLFVSNN